MKWVAAIILAGAIGYLVITYWKASDLLTFSPELSAYVGEWSIAYGVDPLAVSAIIHAETGGNPANFYVADDAGAPSYGPMQVHSGQGAIAQFEQDQNVMIDESQLGNTTGPGLSQAVQIGVYYLSLCIKNASGINPTAFANYNAGVGHYSFPDSDDYGDTAYAYYQSIGGKAGTV